jgi:Prokaryotic E2 family E
VPLPPRLEKELAELRREYPDLNVIEEGPWIGVVFPEFSLGDGFNVRSSDLLVLLQLTYPDSGTDMFWLQKGVSLANGQCPQSAESVEQYFGREWRRFSWHRRGWNPSVDNLQSHLEFVRRRLNEKK